MRASNLAKSWSAAIPGPKGSTKDLIFVSFPGGDCALACAMNIVSTTKAPAITPRARFVFRPDMFLLHIFWFAPLMLESVRQTRWAPRVSSNGSAPSLRLLSNRGRLLADNRHLVRLAQNVVISDRILSDMHHELTSACIFHSFCAKCIRIKDYINRICDFDGNLVLAGAGQWVV